MTPPARTPGQRKQDTLNRLDHDTDAWVATAGPADGTPHLVPLSFLWDGVTILPDAGMRPPSGPHRGLRCACAHWSCTEVTEPRRSEEAET
jgi:hypothetical protein